MLQGLQSTRAKARLAGLIANDNVTSRLLGITSFDPNLAARLAKESIPELRRDSETNAESAAALGSFYLTGLGVKSDPETAFRFYKSAADRGHARATGIASGCYFDGTGVTRDKRKGMEWLRLAVDRGDVHSMVILGDATSSETMAPRTRPWVFNCARRPPGQEASLGCGHVPEYARDRFLRAMEKEERHPCSPNLRSSRG